MRKPKKVEFKLDERSQITHAEAVQEGRICAACGYPRSICVCAAPRAMMTDPARLEQELDDEYLSEIRRELHMRMRDAFIDWARAYEKPFFMAAYSAVNNAWDDVRKDLRRGRITLAEADQIADKLFELKIIDAFTRDWNKQRFQAVVSESQS